MIVLTCVRVIKGILLAKTLNLENGCQQYIEENRGRNHVCVLLPSPSTMNTKCKVIKAEFFFCWKLSMISQAYSRMCCLFYVRLSKSTVISKLLSWITVSLGSKINRLLPTVYIRFPWFPLWGVRPISGMWQYFGGSWAGIALFGWLYLGTLILKTKIFLCEWRHNQIHLKGKGLLSLLQMNIHRILSNKI